jgi:hypothetical protein
VLAVLGRWRALNCPPQQPNRLGWMLPHHDYLTLSAACASRLAVCLKSRRNSTTGSPLNREAMSTTESYEEIIDFIAAGTTPEAVVLWRAQQLRS